MKSMSERGYLILLALAPEPLYGYGVIAAVGELSDGRVKLGAGTLYGTLDKLAADGLLAVDREEVVGGRFRRYYTLTERGTEALTEETERLTRLAARAGRRLARLRTSPQATS